MNTLNNDSQRSTPTLLESPKEAHIFSRANSKSRIFFALLIFIFGLSSGMLIAQFQNAAGIFSVQAGLDIFSEKSREVHLDASTISTIWDHIHEAYIKQPVDDEKLLYSAISGMVSGLNDPYSTYFNPEQASQFLSQIHGEFTGIGAEIASKQGKITVVTPLPESPAEKAGILPGDLILAVDSVDVTAMTVTEVVDRIRGEKGTTVQLLVLRDEGAEPLQFSIVRDTIQIQSVSWSWLSDTRIAHVEVRSFSDDTAASFNEAIGKIIIENPSGIIIDVRNNPGGYLESAVQLSAQFLHKGSVVLYEQHADGTEKQYLTESNPAISSVPVVVLVNEGSASAAEIFAGALKDHSRATVIGETTFGKGSVQDVKKFNDGSILKLTIAHWLTPNKTVIQDTGVTPNYTVVRTIEDFSNDRDPQLDAAQLFFTDKAAFEAMHSQVPQ